MDSILYRADRGSLKQFMLSLCPFEATEVKNTSTRVTHNFSTHTVLYSGVFFSDDTLPTCEEWKRALNQTASKHD